MQRENETLDVVFDGRCGMCTRAAAWIKGKDRHCRLTFHPYQGDGVLERFGLSEEAARTAVWAFSPRAAGVGAGVGSGVGSDSAATDSLHNYSSGHSGAAAVNRVLDTAFGLRIFSAAYGVPGVTWLQDRAYRWVAVNRHRFRGVTPWCDAHPGDCG